MTKTEVMQALLSTEANIPDEVISFVGRNLNDVNDERIEFDHTQNSVFDACGIEDGELAKMHKSVIEFMQELPDGKSQRSRGIEYIVNSGNRKWLIMCAIAGFDRIQDSFDKFMKSKASDLSEEIAEAVLKMIEKRAKRRKHDEEDED